MYIFTERLPADSLILSFDQEGTESSYIVTAFLFDFHRRLSEKGLDPYLKFQSLGVDPIGFGLRYRATHYQGDHDWEKWKAIYPRLDWNIKVNIDLIGSGGVK